MRSTWRTHLLSGALLALCLLLLYACVQVTLRRLYTSSQLTDLRNQLNVQERTNARIADELSRMRSPAWLALLARDRLNFKLPDEQVVFVYKSESPGTVLPAATPPSSPRWQQWWHWLVRGR